MTLDLGTRSRLDRGCSPAQYVPGSTGVRVQERYLGPYLPGTSLYPVSRVHMASCTLYMGPYGPVYGSMRAIWPYIWVNKGYMALY